MTKYFAQEKVVVGVLQQVGHSESVGGVTVTVLDRDSDGNVTKCRGITVPSGVAGYALECVFVDTDKTSGTHKTYVNIGTASSCTFDLVGEISSADITDESIALADIADNALLGKLNIYNDTGGTLNAGTLVRVTGYDGVNGLTVDKADADAVAPATHFVPAAINNAASGDIYELGTLTGYNTGGRSIGDPVYLDPTTAGGLTFTAPNGPDQIVQQVGVVKVVDASDGEIVLFPGMRGITKVGQSFLQGQSVGVNQLHNDARINYVALRVRESLPAPTGSDQLNNRLRVFQAPANSEVVAVRIIPSASTSGSDATNRYEISVYNVTQTQSLSSAALLTDAAELAANTAVELTVDQNRDINNDDVIAINVDIKDDGSAGPTDLSSATFDVEFEYRVRA